MLALPEFSHCYCFADDTKFCSSVDPEKLQSALSTISLWAYDNQMTFHKDKCCYLHFQKTKAYHLVLGHQILQKKSTAVDLGVTISNALSWNAHILTKFVNANKSLNFLRHSVPHQAPSRVKLNLFQSCVVSSSSSIYALQGPWLSPVGTVVVPVSGHDFRRDPGPASFRA